MHHSLDVTREPLLSNSVIKNRSIPNSRIKIKPTKKVPSTNDFDDTTSLKDSHEDSDEEYTSIDTMNDNGQVIFREKMPCQSNRNNIFGILTRKNDNHDLNSIEPNVFSVVSTRADDDSIYNSNADSSSNQTLLSQSENNEMLNSKMDQQLHYEKPSHRYSLEPAKNRRTSVSSLIETFENASMRSSHSSTISKKSTGYLDIIRANTSNCKCADCDAENPTIAITSWLLMICEKCAVIHRQLTSNFLHLESLKIATCDSDIIDLLHDYGNRLSNSLLENDASKKSKPTPNSSETERQEYIRKKYIEKEYLRPYRSKDQHTWSKDELNKLLYENIETADYKKTIHLIILGADPNYSEKNFAVADHAQRHQQTKQMKIILANGGLAEFDIRKNNIDDISESIVHLSNKYGILKELLTRFENDRLKVYPPTRNIDKNQRCLFDIDLNNIIAIYNQSINAVTLRCRFTSSTPTINTSSQCTVVVDEQLSVNEYAWVFPTELQRFLWIREIIKRQFSYHQLISSDFMLLMKLNIQEGINAEKQQVIVIVYPGRFIIYSDTIFDEINLRKYSNLSFHRSEEFTGVILSLISKRFLYLSSPISKLVETLYSCLRQATVVTTLKDLNKQILTSQNIPVIVERFINFLFEHGLLSKGLYRQAGQETKIKQLLSECLEDPFTPTLAPENYTEHDVASALKRFLRQLDIPLIGKRQNYLALIRSTVDDTITSEQMIQYYRALFKDLKQNLPIHYLTLRTMVIHLHTVAMLSDFNGMTMSNLISTFAPCLVSEVVTETTSPIIGTNEDRKISLDDMDMNRFHDQNGTNREEHMNLCGRPSVTKLRRNRSFHSPRDSISSISTLSQFPLTPAYLHVTPSVQANIEIMGNICKYYRELFDITDDEIEHEKTCVETLLAIRNSGSMPPLLEGALISVYFESRADEYNGYPICILEKETTADMVVEKLLKQVDVRDCFFWSLFEVIIDQNLERPMYSCENITDVLQRYRTYLSHELNFHATFVVKLNYIQFEKERLEQRQQVFNNQSVECEYFDLLYQRWMPCFWIFERAVLKIYRIPNNINEKTARLKSNTNTSESNSNVLTDPHSLTYSWSVEDIYLYIGADCRFIDPFDMNEYRVLTILPPDIPKSNEPESAFGISFRFLDRNQMFSWYLELVHINGHDKWIREAPRTMPDGVNYLPLQNYHTALSSTSSIRNKPDLFKNKFVAKSYHVASNLCKQLKK